MKDFLLKLISWNRRDNKDWSKAREKEKVETEMARERGEINKREIGERKWQPIEIPNPEKPPESK